MIDRQHITGVVRAGGRGSRMGGVDKGLQAHRSMPLTQRAHARLQSPLGPLMINANRRLAAYEGVGVQVFRDTRSERQQWHQQTLP